MRYLLTIIFAIAPCVVADLFGDAISLAFLGGMLWTTVYATIIEFSKLVTRQP